MNPVRNLYYLDESAYNCSGVIWMNPVRNLSSHVVTNRLKVYCDLNYACKLGGF
jgi:hypothetical protein